MTKQGRAREEELLGSRIGGVRLEKLLGRGAMGAVFLGVQESLDRRVALKVLSSAPLNEEASVERFFKEARAAARINHPNVVQVYDAGRTENGLVPFIIMELVEGEGLGRRIKRLGKIAAFDAVEIVLGAARGLVAAHDRGLIHRDIKPDNILIAPDGTPKLADFGLTKDLDGGEMTVAGHLLGTPNYMSPEACSGIPLDARSDLYSMGVTLFFAVTGKMPFKASTLHGLLLEHITRAPPKPRSIEASVPPPLEELILRLLEKKPEDRFATARDLVAELVSVRGACSGALGREPGAGAIGAVSGRRNGGAGALPEVGARQALAPQEVANAEPAPHPAARDACAPPLEETPSKGLQSQITGTAALPPEFFATPRAETPPAALLDGCAARQEVVPVERDGAGFTPTPYPLASSPAAPASVPIEVPLPASPEPVAPSPPPPGGSETAEPRAAPPEETAGEKPAIQFAGPSPLERGDTKRKRRGEAPDGCAEQPPIRVELRPPRSGEPLLVSADPPAPLEPRAVVPESQRLADDRGRPEPVPDTPAEPSIAVFQPLREDASLEPGLSAEELMLRAKIHYARRNWADAEGDFARVIELTPGSALAYFALACVRARQRKDGPALDSLDRSIALGFRNRDEIQSSPDLAPLAANVRWREVLAKL